MRARHLLVSLLALVPLVACSGDDVVEGLTGPTGLDVRGNYDVIGSFEIYDVGDPVDAWSCAGTVAIPTQVGNQFSGTWALNAGMDCPGPAGGAITGSVDGDTDNATVDFVIPLRDDIVEAISGCTITSGDSNTFYGYIDPDAGSANLTAEFTADCLVEGNIRGYTFVIRFF